MGKCAPLRGKASSVRNVLLENEAADVQTDTEAVNTVCGMGKLF
jgi:hypothetical protein